VRSSSPMGGALVPALLNNRSSRPKVSCVLANKPRTAAGSPTSVGTTSPCAPAGPAIVTVSSNSSWRRPARATPYPSCNSARATLLPMPVPAPVTIATFVNALMRHISFSVGWIRYGQEHQSIKHLLSGEGCVLCEQLIEGCTDDFELAFYSGSPHALRSYSLHHLYSWQALSLHACLA